MKSWTCKSCGWVNNRANESSYYRCSNCTRRSNASPTNVSVIVEDRSAEFVYDKCREKRQLGKTIELLTDRNGMPWELGYSVASGPSWVR